MCKTLILAAIAALAFSSVADAKMICKDAKGHFMKCPPPAAAPAKAAPCKDAKGKFIKCSPSVLAATPSGQPLAINPKGDALRVGPGAGRTVHCVKGKPCGKSCIAMDKVCHK